MGVNASMPAATLVVRRGVFGGVGRKSDVGGAAATPTEPSDSRLLRIPEELLRRVLLRVEWGSLAALRATCRATRAAIDALGVAHLQARALAGGATAAELSSVAILFTVCRAEGRLMAALRGRRSLVARRPCTTAQQPTSHNRPTRPQVSDENAHIVCAYVEERQLPSPARVSVSLAALAALGDEGASALAAALAGAGSVRELRFWEDSDVVWPPMNAIERQTESQKQMRRLRVLLAELPALHCLDVACLADLSGRNSVRS
jgi:hypothetical protein